MYLTSKVESTHLSFVNVTLNKYKHDKRDKRCYGSVTSRSEYTHLT